MPSLQDLKKSFTFCYLVYLIFLNLYPHIMQNKCNVGYAFINMIDPSHIIPLYEVCFLANF